MVQDPQFDVVMVGGGHNGLACWALAGMNVLVLKGRSVPGGEAAATEEPRPAFQASSVSHAVSLVPAQIDEELRLADFGCQVSIMDRLDTESLVGAGRPGLGPQTTTPPFEKGSP